MWGRRSDYGPGEIGWHALLRPETKFLKKEKRRRTLKICTPVFSLRCILRKTNSKIKTFLPSRGRLRFMRGYLTSVAPSFSNQEPTNSGWEFLPTLQGEAWRGRGWSVLQVCLHPETETVSGHRCRTRRGPPLRSGLVPIHHQRNEVIGEKQLQRLCPSLNAVTPSIRTGT